MEVGVRSIVAVVAVVGVVSKSLLLAVAIASVHVVVGILVSLLLMVNLKALLTAVAEESRRLARLVPAPNYRCRRGLC